MEKLLHVLLHPLLWAVIGLFALSALIWWVGPLVAIGSWRPLDGVWSRGVLIALLFAGLAGKFALAAWRRRKTNAALVDGIAKGPKTADRELNTLNERFAQAIEVLKTSGGRSVFQRGQFLYELPWYIFIGAPGSGKTTALLNAGLTFPLAEKLGNASVRGVGGTRNCDWWFTDRAVLIDTAGRYTMQESDAQVDASAWDGFLALLKKSRPRRPINGVLLTVNIQDLLQQSPPERKEHAAKLRARMQELTEKLGVRAPVYVLVTKADLIAGFNAMFADLGKEERNQVWGFSFPYTPDSEDDPLAQFGSEFAALEKRLRDRVMARMNAEHEVLERAAIFDFPQQFAGIRGLLGGFLEQVFGGGGSLEERPLLRGVYFTSGTQEGTPIDRVMGTLARTFGVERRLPQAAGARGKSFFLHRLLQDVVFEEQGLVGENRRVEARRGRWRFAGFATTALVSVVLIGGWAVSFVKNRAYVAEVEARLPEVTQAVATVPPATSGDVTPLPPVLNLVRGTARTPAFELADPPLAMTFGLYQGEKLDAGVELGYNRLLDKALMPRVVRRLEERLRGASRDNLEFAYEALKNYLMLYAPQHFEPESFKAWVAIDWDATLERSLRPEDREALAAHLDALLQHGAPPPAAAMDEQLVAGVRDMLVAYPLEFRIFSRLKRMRVGADIPAFSVASAAGPSALTVFERVSGEPLTQGIPGLFTRDGYREAFEKSVERATRQLAGEEEWVLGVKRPAGALSSVRADPELTDRVRRLYFEEYIKTWDRYIADVRIVPMSGLDQSLQVARALSGVDSPLAAFMRGVTRETTLVQKREEIDMNTVAGSIKYRLDEAKEELAALSGGVQGPKSAGLNNGRPLEQMVDDHFAHIHRLMEGTPPPMDAVLRLFNDVYVQLSAVDQAQKTRSAPPPAGAAERIRAEAAQQPEPIRSMLETLSGAAATQGRTVERQSLTSELKPVADVCRRAINGRYPFTPSSKADVLPEDFSQLFGVGGLFDEFFQSRLAPLVDTGANPWRFKPTGDNSRPVNVAALADFQRAARIKEVFFRGGGKNPSFKVDLRAIELMDGLESVSMDIDGQVYKFLPGNTAPISVQWPSPRVASQIKLQPEGGTAMLFEGPWALFRLFDRFDVQPSAQPEKFTVVMNLGGKRARFEVTASSVFNPFRLREVQQFRCPGSL